MYSDERKRGAVLVLEDSKVEREGLRRGLLPHFDQVITAGTLAEALAITTGFELTHAVLDLSLPDGSSIDLIPVITSYHPSISIVVVTGFGSYAAAVEAIKLGARDFLAKPASFEQILAALDGKAVRGAGNGRAGRSRPVPLTLARVEWEHINRVLAESNWNISEAARRLGLQRQSLQRKLRKLAPRHPTVGSTDDDDRRLPAAGVSGDRG